MRPTKSLHIGSRLWVDFSGSRAFCTEELGGPSWQVLVARRRAFADLTFT